MSLQDHFDALREATEPDAARVARIRRPQRRPSPVWWGVPAAAVALALLWTLRTPETVSPPEPLPPSEPAAVDVAAAFDGAGEQKLGPHVAVVTQGRGAVSGTADDLLVSWASGRIDVRVEPGRGVQLEVQTAEARVTVTGTVFRVVRDAFGTTVSVSEGSVDVVCGELDAVDVRDRNHTCFPVHAVGWLRRVTALRQAGRHDEVLTAVATALALEPVPAVAIELRFQEVEAFVSLGRRAEARAALARLAREHPSTSTRAASVSARIVEP